MTHEEGQAPELHLTYLTSIYLAAPGKCIWDCPVIYRKPRLADQVEHGLSLVPGVTAGRANFWTGRIHVSYSISEVTPEPGQPDADVAQTLLAQYVDQVVIVCVTNYAQDAKAPDPQDPAAMTAAAFQLTRELAEILYHEASGALQAASRQEPGHQPTLIRLWLQMRGLMRQPGGVPTEPSSHASHASHATDGTDGTDGANVVDADAHSADEPNAHVETDARDHDANAQASANSAGPTNDHPLYASMPSLEPLISGLAHTLVERYGEARIADFVESARTGSPTRMLEGLLAGIPMGGQDVPPRRGIIGGILNRIGEVGSLLREVRAAASRPSAETPPTASPDNEPDNDPDPKQDAPK